MRGNYAGGFFSLRFAGTVLARPRCSCFDACVPKARKVTCEECFFKRNMLCALDVDEPCATFRPHEAGLKPPQQLRFVFRQERRSRSVWAFPTAQEQAAQYA